MFLMAPDARSPTEGHDPTPRNGPPCTVRRQRSMPAMNYREKTTPGHRHSLMTFPPGAGNSPPKDKQMYPPSCLGLPTWELKPTVQCSPRLNIQQAEHQAVATRATLCVTKDILSHQCSPQGLALLLPGYLHRRRELPCARSSRQRTKGPDQCQVPAACRLADSMKRAQQRRDREGGGRGTQTERERERLREGDKCRKQKSERKRARARSHARESISATKASEYSCCAKATKFWNIVLRQRSFKSKVRAKHNTFSLHCKTDGGKGGVCGWSLTLYTL